MNQREIKFRYWTKDGQMSKEFLLQETIGNENWDNLIPMQYTGLKDKNGKEIYEGDIINGYLTLVDEDNYDFQDIIEYKYCSFQCPNNADFPLNAYTEIEVIGNIYENPELMGDRI